MKHTTNLLEDHKQTFCNGKVSKVTVTNTG